MKRLHVGSIWRQAKRNFTLKVIEANVPKTKEKIGFNDAKPLTIKKRKVCLQVLQIVEMLKLVSKTPQKL